MQHSSRMHTRMHALTHSHAHRSSYLFKILREFVHKASHDIVSLLTYGRDNDERRDTRSSTYLSICFYRGGSVNMRIAANFALATTISKRRGMMTRIKLPRLKLERECKPTFTRQTGYLESRSIRR